MFWNGKRVLLTGHTGFKGSWLAIWLRSLGAEVTGFALPPPTTPSMFTLTGLAEQINHIVGDIRDLAALQAATHQAQPEIVIHMAAQPLVRYSYTNPVETYATNVMGTVHLLEAVRQVGGVRVVVIVTSDKCYENREWAWGYRENEPMGGHDPYSNSKGCAELVTAAYRASYFPAERYAEHGVAVGSGRAGNVIGGGDWATDRLIPDIVRAFEANQAVRIRNPRSIRPWQHVLEPLSGYMQLAEKLWHTGPQFAEGWNFGPAESDARPVGWIVEHMAHAYGPDARWEFDPGPHPHEARYLKLDCSRAHAELGWLPRLKLATALDWTVEWYQARVNGANMLATTEAQIATYQATAPQKD
jgi:CDP-glucose 4,6-dehydratase